MASRWAVAGALAAVQAAALAATFPFKPLGTAWWHHLASLGAVLAAAACMPRAMSSRRFLGIGVLATSALATVSGFYLLYWKEGIRADGYQDWGVFWHVAWSWAAAVFFWQHTWVNRVAFAHFLRRSLRQAYPAVLHVSAYAVSIGALAWTIGPGQDRFTNENYIPLSYWTWLAVTAVAYAAWWALRSRGRAVQLRARAAVDLALVPVAAAVVVSGIPLLWFDPQMEVLGLKYASKYWHVGPSVLFAVLAFTHSAQLWPIVRGHWRHIASARAA
ncbi:MAG TPA: hypothetical protein VFH47_03330 [Candidatus Thermoplasmatota archaeon]|nr:hypothetical protein [Candidatus Thermoplasmatota archaeon]